MPGPDGWEPLSEDVRRTLELLPAGEPDAGRRFRDRIPHADPPRPGAAA
ncbi:hypothetical protein ACWGIU_02545 [Streptomyces sp. NPDC054840]